MRNYFTLDGVDSRDFGLYISGSGTYSAPARRYDFFKIPGKNGDVIHSDGTFENGLLKYPASFIHKNMKTNIAAFRSFLLSRDGYVNLVDTYHPNERRQVCYIGSFEPDVTPTFSAAQFDLEFNCKPQRWLISGDVGTTVNNGETGSISNPTKFPAKPLIKIYGNGSFNYSYIDSSGPQPLIVTTTITLDTVGTSQNPVFIDTETMYIYQESINGVIVNRSPYVAISTHDIPAIRPESNITISGVTVEKVEITPRWWTL